MSPFRLAARRSFTSGLFSISDDFQRVKGHIETVATIDRFGVIYRAQTPFTPYYYHVHDLRFAYHPHRVRFIVSVNDCVEFFVEQQGDKHYARNITTPGGRPLRTPLIRSHRPRPRMIDGDYKDEDRIRVSLVLHPLRRVQGVVISCERNGYGWILCALPHSLPVRFHYTQIQAVGMKRVALHSRVELSVIGGRFHDWAFYVTKPGRNLITFEKADLYGQWLKSLEMGKSSSSSSSDASAQAPEPIIYTGFVAHFILRSGTGAVVPCDDIGAAYAFHIDHCHTAPRMNRRVFLNEAVSFELVYKPHLRQVHAVNLRSLESADGAIRGRHWNWNAVSPYQRKYCVSWMRLRRCVSGMSEQARYRGLVEFDVYEKPLIHNLKIYFDRVSIYARTLRLSLDELASSDVQQIRRGTKVEFSVRIDRDTQTITKAVQVSAPNAQLLTFYHGELGKFYRWRNLNCEVQLPSVLDELEQRLWTGENVRLLGFIRHVDRNRGCGAIEVVSNTACYEPLFFRFDDVLGIDLDNYKANENANEDIRPCVIKIGSVVQFAVAINHRCFRYKINATKRRHYTNKEDGDGNGNGNRWTKEPQTYLTAKAINVCSYNRSVYDWRSPPMFKLSQHVEKYGKNKQSIGE